MDAQREFFREIKLRVKDNMLIAQMLCDLLKIKPDSAYRRIRGETELTLTELVTLGTYFNISLDTIFYRKDGNGNYTYRKFDIADIANGYIPLLAHISDILEQTYQSKEKEIIHTVQEIQTIHTLLFDKLFLFRLYVWYRNERNDKRPLTYDNFLLELGDLENTLIGYRNKITAYYKQIPSIEIWSERALDPLLHLLEYYFDIGCFEDISHPVTICLQLDQLVGMIEAWSEQGVKKFEGKLSPFSMYKSPVDMQNSYTYISRNGEATVFIKMFAINGVFTDDKLIVSDTSNWINNILSVSQHLSGVSERERIIFFNHLRNKIREISDKIGKRTICL